MSKVDKKVALEELNSFLKKHLKKEFRRGQMTEAKIEEEFIDVLEALEDGFLVFKDGKPEYTLRNPLFANAEDQSLVVKKVEFRTRIKAVDKNLLMDGLDVKKQIGTYTVKIISYITQLSMAEVKELEQEDYDVLNQLCSVF